MKNNLLSFSLFHHTDVNFLLSKCYKNINEVSASSFKKITIVVSFSQQQRLYETSDIEVNENPSSWPMRVKMPFKFRKKQDGMHVILWR